jgi:Protein of unknown function (DUF3224)
MTSKLETSIKIDNWDEQPTQEYDDGTKVAHAVVKLTDGNDGLRSGLMESVLYYGADGTSSYVGVLHLDGELDGKSGSFTAIGHGVYDGTTATSMMPIVQGTGDLDGITGSVSSRSTHEDYPNMPLVIEYELG